MRQNLSVIAGHNQH